MVDEPVTDEDVPAVWRALGLPGLVDLHVHFMPDTVLRKVWAYFDRAGPLTGAEWPITYRYDEGERLARLRAVGVRAFPSLLYPHKPGMAEWLNGWAHQFAAATPGVVPTFTFFPEPDAASYVAKAIEAGGRIGKAHVQVGGYDPRDPLLDPVWGLVADAGVPVVVHTGSGPAPGAFTGPGPFAEVLARHPQLSVLLAHMGMPEYDEFVALARRYSGLRFDTAMAFTDFTEARAPWPRELSAELRTLGLAGRVVLGSDYPNVPHPYAHQVAGLVRLGFGDDWLREVLHDAGARLLALP